MKFGYARVSTAEQDTALQRAALQTEGVHRVFDEKRSGVRSRPLLEALLYCLRPGDLVVVYKVDRFARSLTDLLRILARIETAGATFKSLTEPLETASPMGRFMVHTLGAFAEFERSVIRERCAAGMRAAMDRGMKWGRPCRLDWQAISLAREAGESINQIAQRMECHHTAVRWALKRYEPDAWDAKPKLL